MKIVINSCFGGFGLSDEAVELYLTKKGYNFAVKEVTYKPLSGNVYLIQTESGEYRTFYEFDLERNDPILVEVVEELGKKANGRCADLVIEDIPTGALYRITEYDGNESIEYNFDINWKVAT